MSITPEQTIELYDKASESVIESGGGAHPNLIVSDIKHADPSHFIKYVEDSVIYDPRDGYKRARERYVMQSYFRSPFAQLQLPLQQLALTMYNSLGIVKEQYISISLPVNASANVTLPRGWGYLLIDQVTILAAGQSLYFSGEQVIQWLHHICQTQSMFDAMWATGGEARTGAWAAGEPTASCLLPLPWCDPSLPALDTALLQSNSIQITVSMKNLTAVLGGSGSPAIANTLATGAWIARTGYFTNSADSAIQELVYHSLLQEPLVYGLLFEYYQGEIFRNIACSSTADTTINLSALTISRPLMGVVVTAILSSDANPGGTLPINPAAYVQMSNILLTFESRQLVSTVGNEYELQRIMLADGRPAFVNNVYFAGGAVAPYTQTNVQNPVYRFMFTLKDETDVVEYGVHGVNAMTLTFRTPTTANHNFQVSYLYDMSMQFDGTSVKLV